MIPNRGPSDCHCRGSFVGLMTWLNCSDSTSQSLGTRKNLSSSPLNRPEDAPPPQPEDVCPDGSGNLGLKNSQ